MSDLVKHTLTINISDRIEWIDKRCGLTEIQKDYVTAQMKEAVADAVQQANGVDTGEKQCNLPVVMPRILHFVDENGNNVDLSAAGVNAKLLRDGTFEYFISYGFAGRKELTPVYGA